MPATMSTSKTFLHLILLPNWPGTTKSSSAITGKIEHLTRKRDLRIEFWTWADSKQFSEQIKINAVGWTCSSWVDASGGSTMIGMPRLIMTGARNRAKTWAEASASAWSWSTRMKPPMLRSTSLLLLVAVNSPTCDLWLVLTYIDLCQVFFMSSESISWWFNRY